MKILLFGRGVIATIYGWALEQAGHDLVVDAVDLEHRGPQRTLSGSDGGADVGDGHERAPLTSGEWTVKRRQSRPDAPAAGRR